MINPESWQLRQRREYMMRLSQQPASILIADPQRVQFGIKILEIQYRKIEVAKI